MPALSPSTSRPLALIVDNHADTRDMYATHLSAHGIRVEEAAAGGPALVKAKALRPDIITTDLNLTDFGGHTLCQRLKDDEATKGIPVIAVTGRVMPSEVKIALAAGCVSVLIKPCLPEALLAEIRRVLNDVSST